MQETIYTVFHQQNKTNTKPKNGVIRPENNGLVIMMACNGSGRNNLVIEMECKIIDSMTTK